MKWTLEQVAELYRRYEEEELTLAEIGQQQNPSISHARVGQLFAEFGFVPRSRGREAAIKAQNHRREIVERADEIVAAYKEIGDVNDTARTFNLPYHLVAKLIRKRIPSQERERYRRHGTPIARIGEETISECVRKAAEVCGEPLSVACYRRAAQELGLVADATVMKFYGDYDHPWQKALEVAGVKSNLPNRLYHGFTKEDCRKAIRQFIKETGHYSYSRYAAWATDRKVPKGPTVRLKYRGSWAAATKDALESD